MACFKVYTVLGFTLVCAYVTVLNFQLVYNKQMTEVTSGWCRKKFAFIPSCQATEKRFANHIQVYANVWVPLVKWHVLLIFQVKISYHILYREHTFSVQILFICWNEHIGKKIKHKIWPVQKLWHILYFMFYVFQ